MTDVERLRNLARNLRSDAWDYGGHNTEAGSRWATLWNAEVNALDRAADALDPLDAARGAVPLETASSTDGRRAYLVIPWRDSLTGESTKCEWSLGSPSDAAHRLLATALALLEADRG
jgi:hypothetical protein